MSSVEELPLAARKPTEYEALVAAGLSALDAIPGAVYICDHEGWLVQYNSEAATVWGRAPALGDRKERFCGSHRLFFSDGTALPHENCPMAEAVRSGSDTRNAEVIIERPDGSRTVALVNIRALRNHRGRIQGAINCFQDISAQKAMESDLHQAERALRESE